jgi:hypothetical protein
MDNRLRVDNNLNVIILCTKEIMSLYHLQTLPCRTPCLRNIKKIMLETNAGINPGGSGSKDFFLKTNNSMKDMVN